MDSLSLKLIYLFLFPLSSHMNVYTRNLLYDAKHEKFDDVLNDLEYDDINIHIKDELGRTPLEIAELLLGVASDEKYSEYKQEYEKIIVLLQSFAFSEHQTQNNSTNLNH